MWKKPLDDELLTPRMYCDLTGVSTMTAARQRREGTGPAFLKLGRKVLYRRAAISAWMQGLEVKSTTEHKSRALSSKQSKAE